MPKDLLNLEAIFFKKRLHFISENIAEGERHHFAIGQVFITHFLVMPFHMQKLFSMLISDFICETKLLPGFAVDFLIKSNSSCLFCK